MNPNIIQSIFSSMRIIGKASVSHNDWEKRLEGMRIRSNIKEEIIFLARYDKDMQKAITMDSEYTKEVTFAYLEMIGIKRYVRERRKYDRLLKTLSKLKIALVIR